MKTTAERLRQFESNVPSRWREKALNRLANQEERRKARTYALKIWNALDNIGLSGESLAEKLGIGYDDLSPILKGHKLPSPCVDAQIMSILNQS